MNTGPAPADQQINNLKHDWDQLSDPDRALAIAQIKKSGLSQREIARRLGRGESSIRRLLLLLHAPAADFAAARNGTLSTNELGRRANTALQRQAAQRKHVAKREREYQAADGARLICDWLKVQNMSGPDGEGIINLVRDKFILASRTDTPLPAIKIPAGRSQAELIELCRPKRPVPDGAENLNWYADWLTWWVLYVFPDSDGRDNALDLALERQWKR